MPKLYDEDGKLPAYWMKMSEKKLHNHIMSNRNLPPSILNKTLERALAQRRAMRKERIKQTTARNFWGELLEAPRQELKHVRILKRHAVRRNKPSEERMTALLEYEAVLMKMIRRFVNLESKGDYTPMQLAKALKAEKVRDIPNGGVHWTDWVDAQDRERVEQLFLAIDQPRGKRKIPFERTIPWDKATIARGKLQDAIYKEIDATEALLDMTTGEELLEKLTAKLNQLQEALVKLRELDLNAPVPYTWHGLLKDEQLG